MHLYYSFTLTFEHACAGSVVGFEAETLVSVEPPWRYHPCLFGVLTQARYPGRGQCVVGSLTGAVSSQRVTEEREGTLNPVGNRMVSAKA